MENKQDSSHEEEHPTLPTTNYRALIHMTRPLMVVKDTALPPGLPICRDQAAWPRTLGPEADAALETGEILPVETPTPAGQADAEPSAAQADAPAVAAEDEQDGTADRDSNLTLRIYLGMS